MVFILEPSDTADRSPEWPNWIKSKKQEVEDPGMESSPVASHSTQREATLDGRLDVAESTVVTFLPADLKHAEELDFDESEVIALFKKKK